MPVTNISIPLSNNSIYLMQAGQEFPASEEGFGVCIDSTARNVDFSNINIENDLYGNCFEIDAPALRPESVSVNFNFIHIRNSGKYISDDSYTVQNGINRIVQWQRDRTQLVLVDGSAGDWLLYVHDATPAKRNIVAQADSFNPGNRAYFILYTGFIIDVSRDILTFSKNEMNKSNFVFVVNDYCKYNNPGDWYESCLKSKINSEYIWDVGV